MIKKSCDVQTSNYKKTSTTTPTATTTTTSKEKTLSIYFFQESK